MKKIKILSIDGGGIRGILPGVVLDRLEQKLQQASGNSNTRLADVFDFMAGTSTGGILTLAYLTPDQQQRPRLSAGEAVNLYLENGDKIFRTGLWQKIRNGAGLTDEKYHAGELEKALKDTFGDAKLSDLLKPCLISAYDIGNGKPHFFKQHRSSNAIYNFLVKDVARATSAAPTYFEAARVTNDLKTPFALVDGGVYANNPALAAYAEVRTMDFNSNDELPTAKDMLIISLGTGSTSKKYDYQKAKDWGAIGWIRPVIEIMMSGNSRTVHYYLHQIYHSLDEKDRADYYRLEPELIKADTEMDNASPKNMSNLKEDALNYLCLEKNDQQLDEIVNKLLEY